MHRISPVRGCAASRPCLPRPWATGVRHSRRPLSVRAWEGAEAASQRRIRDFGFARDFGSKYEVQELIGQGSFGRVHVCVERATGERFAVKSIPKRFRGGDASGPPFLEDAYVRRVWHEVDIYEALGRSLNVAAMYGAYEDAQTCHLVMQLCSGGDLWGRVRRGAYSERDAARLMGEVLRTVAQCHARGVVLRDVKPDNFLFLTDDDDSPLKMIDFGIAEYCRPGEVLTQRCGTPVYVAPEVLRQKYSLPADLWSAGIIAYQLLTGRLPFVMDDDGSSRYRDGSYDSGDGGSGGGSYGGGDGGRSASGRGSSAAATAAATASTSAPSPSSSSTSVVPPAAVAVAQQQQQQQRRRQYNVAGRRYMFSSLEMSRYAFSNKDLFHATLYADLDFDSPPWSEGSSSSSSSSGDAEQGGGGGGGGGTTLSAAARDFVQSLLQRDPSKRPTALEALSHPWLAGSDNGNDSTLAGAGAGGRPQQAPPPLADTLVQRLQRFGTYGKLKQAALRILTRQLLAVAATPTAAQGDAEGRAGAPAAARQEQLGGEQQQQQQQLQPLLAALADAQAALQPDEYGRVPLNRLEALLLQGGSSSSNGSGSSSSSTSSGYDLSPLEVRQLLSQFTADPADGCVDVHQWVAALLDWPQLQASGQWEAWVAQVFETFDSGHEGRLSPSELESVLCGDVCPFPDVVASALREAHAGLNVSNMASAAAAGGDNNRASAEGITLEEFATLLRQGAESDQLLLFEARRRRQS